jgi:hypothetical protein
MNPNPDQPEEFISEAIQPAVGSFDVGAMSRGEPGLPSQFKWRGKTYIVVRLLSAWKSSSREGGVGELYLRRHWFSIETANGEFMTLYCERQAKNRKQPKARWWLYSMRGRPTDA